MPMVQNIRQVSGILASGHRQCAAPGSPEILMNGMALIIASALLVGLGALSLLLWALRSRQYEDLDGAAARILLDDD